MKFNKTTLSCGIDLVSLEMEGFNSVSFNLLVGTGSRHESEKEWGISHFLEHMAFKGTKKRSAKDIAEEFDAIGGCFNAYTSKEVTCYYAKVVKDNLEEAVDIISDIIQNSVFDKEDIAREYDVICQEIAQTQDSPEELAYENLMEVIFKNQNLGRPILGSSESIKNLGKKDFQDYMSKKYTTQNIVLSFAGAVNHSKIVEIAEKKFGNINKGIRPKAEFAIYKPGFINISKELEQATLYIGFESVPYCDVTEYYHTQILSLILGGNMSSRLFQKIREELGLAYSVGSFNCSFMDTGIFSIYAGTSHDKVSLVSEKISEEISNFLEYGVQDIELERAKSKIKAGIILQEEKTSAKSEELARQYFIFGKYINAAETLNIVMNTSKEDLREIGFKIFSSKPSVSIIGNNIKFEYERFALGLL